MTINHSDGFIAGKKTWTQRWYKKCFKETKKTEQECRNFRKLKLFPLKKTYFNRQFEFSSHDNGIQSC